MKREHIPEWSEYVSYLVGKELTDDKIEDGLLEQATEGCRRWLEIEAKSILYLKHWSDLKYRIWHSRFVRDYPEEDRFGIDTTN